MSGHTEWNFTTGWFQESRAGSRKPETWYAVKAAEVGLEEDEERHSLSM